MRETVCRKVQNLEPKPGSNIGEGRHLQRCVTRPVRAKEQKVAVFVLDRSGKALMPCSEKRARLLLARDRARVHRLVPFVIRLKDRLVSDSQFQPIKIKLDPGSKVTGIAVVRESVRVDAETGEAQASVHVLSLFELTHRGRQISEALTARRQMRRRRRGDLRYRAPRFLNRGNKGKGWLPPSLRHRIITTMSWVKRLQRWAPVTGADQELVRFDLQKIENPEIAGVEYQQGALAGYEVREYLLEKWGRKCAYCGAEHVPINIDHIHPKAKGGTDRVSNLTLACVPCNQKKGAQDVRTFVKDAKRLERILGQARRPLKDAAAVNSTRWALFDALKRTGLPATTGSGGLTKFNRAQFGIPKARALDAACVGSVSEVLNWQKPTLSIKATGRGCYQRTRLDAFGFPRGYLTRKKSVHGFQTGDRVKAVVPNGKKAGAYTGRVAVRATGSFNIQTPEGVVQGISHRHCRVIQRADGYGYSQAAKMESERVSCKARNAARSALYLPRINAGVSRAK
nr:RNA-guided endonuclease IscB [Ferrovum sp.]